MGRIIRLTERDLTRLVKRTITELDRTTYEKAGDVADEKGFNKLADKFREHGKNTGLNQERNNITMVIQTRSGDDIEMILRLIKLRKNYSESSYFTLETEDLDPDERYGSTPSSSKLKVDFTIKAEGSKMSFYSQSNAMKVALPATKKDAIKVIRFFKDNGFSEVSDAIDPRSISYDDSGF
jgi:hypothetical protein